MEIGTRSGWTEPHAASQALRLHVRHGAAGLLAREALLLAGWALLWLAFLLAVSSAAPRWSAGEARRPGGAQVEASAPATGAATRG